MERLIPLCETMVVEFKSDKKKLPDSDIIDAVVAFANTKGGDLYLGVEDDGTVTGLHPEHKDSTRLAAFVANRTIPPVSVRVEHIDAEFPVLMIQHDEIIFSASLIDSCMTYKQSKDYNVCFY